MYRLLEILPGFLAWLTIIMMILGSWIAPAVAAIFIIVFDIYWLLKTLYLSLHLRATFNKMRENMTTDWIKKLNKLSYQWRDIRHLVILPVYKEPYAVVKESVGAIAASRYPNEKIILVLAIEERAGNEAKEIAQRIESDFKNKFSAFIVSVHPQNLPAEIPGKGSNEAWAGKRAQEFIDSLPADKKIPYEKIIVSVFDADTQAPSGYFGILTHAFLTAERPQRSSFQPIPLFTNNIFQAPALARIISFSSTFWHMMQQSRPEQLTTFSSHSMPFKALVEIGFWRRDIVSEDSQIFWQCFLHYDGDWRAVPLFYPVFMDANAAPTFWKTMKNIYLQQRRWAWGVENIPYAFFGFLKNPRITSVAKRFWAFKKIEAFWSWATNAILIFVLGLLPGFIGGSVFGTSVLSYNLPRITRTIMLFAMFGIASSAVLSILLLPPKPEWFKPRHYFLYLIQWILMPLTFIIFGSIPALEAQTRMMLGGKFRLGFWATPKYR